MSSTSCPAPSVSPPASSRLARRAAIGLIRAYQVAVSPWLGTHCRYAPTCSSYASEAIARHGLWRGVGRALRRLMRCHPFGGAGYDPVD